MKTIIDDLISNLKRIKPETIYARSVSKEALDEAANANVDQLEKGQLDNGQQIGGYSKATEAYNTKRKTKISAGDTITFKDTGQFHKSIKAKITRDGELEIYSRSKKAILAQTYVDKNSTIAGGGNVLGLNDQNLQAWYEYFVEDAFINNLTDRILNY